VRVDGDAHRKMIDKRTVTVWPTNKQLQDPRPKSFKISCCRDPALKALRHWDRWHRRHQLRYDYRYRHCYRRQSPRQSRSHSRRRRWQQQQQQQRQRRPFRHLRTPRGREHKTRRLRGRGSPSARAARRCAGPRRALLLCALRARSLACGSLRRLGLGWLREVGEWVSERVRKAGRCERGGEG